jgi:hypothetical protein
MGLVVGKEVGFPGSAGGEKNSGTVEVFIGTDPINEGTDGCRIEKYKITIPAAARMNVMSKYRSRDEWRVNVLWAVL